MKAQTPQEAANEQTIRKLYSLANATTKDTPGFVAMFGNGGYFYDVGAGKKYYGQDIGVTVDNYATAFPDMHREFINLYTADDLVVVELTLNGTRTRPRFAAFEQPKLFVEEMRNAFKSRRG